jgi:hypothetical protein
MKKSALSLVAFIFLHAGIAQPQDAAPEQLRPSS